MLKIITSRCHFPKPGALRQVHVRSCSLSSVWELEDSFDLLQDERFDSIRAKGEQDGYLFFRNFFPSNDVLQVRKDIVEVLHKYKWIDSSQGDMTYGTKVSPNSNIKAKIESIDDPDYWPVFDDIQNLESFHIFAHHPALLHFFQRFLNAKVLVHPRNIFRAIYPHNNDGTTSPHQDWVYIQGLQLLIIYNHVT